MGLTPFMLGVEWRLFKLYVVKVLLYLSLALSGVIAWIRECCARKRFLDPFFIFGNLLAGSKEFPFTQEGKDSCSLS
jgi:hypothetical protein